MNYSEVIETLFTRRVFSIPHRSLDICRTFAKELGNPHQKFPTIHIAGTNGKGSVALKIAKAYEALGKKVGLYTSPHLFSYRERISINGVEIPEERVVQGLLSLFDLAQQIDPSASFFELSTYLAFHYFSEEEIEIGIIETGIGGLHDTTNIITPLLSVITSIGKDHTALLGSTLEEIAFQKAGIIKPGVPVVIGPSADFPIMHAKAEELYSIPPTPGFYDLENSAIARKALEVLGVPEFAIQAGLVHRPPCRFEQKGNVIFDVAHNPQGFDRLLEAIEWHFPHKPFAAAIGMSKDKNVEECLEKMAKRAKHIYLLKANHTRAISVEEVATILKKKGYFSFSEGIDLLPQEELLVVCGTFFIMEQAHRCLFGCQVGVK